MPSDRAGLSPYRKFRFHCLRSGCPRDLWSSRRHDSGEVVMFSKLRSSARRRSPWLLAAVAAVGYAAIPDADGVIHGCSSKGRGVLRIIDTEQGETCTSNETAIQWNQTGPLGP